MDANRRRYIEECKDKFHTLQGQNKILIHYIREGTGNFVEDKREHFVKGKDGNFVLDSKPYYFQNKKGPRTGVIVACKPADTSEIRFGWSLCHSNLDSFNKYVGLMKALDRLENGSPMIEDEYLYLPKCIENDMAAFMERAKKYFK